MRPGTSHYACRMRNRPGSGKTLALLALLACGVGAAQARTLRLHADEVVAAAGSFRQVDVVLEWPDDAPQGQLRLQAELLEVPSIVYSARRVDWRCPLQRTTDGGWRCSGLVRAGNSASFPLTLEISPAATRMDLRIAGSGVSYESVAAAPDLSRLRLERVPVAWLKAYLATMWKDGQWTQGTLAGTVDIVTPKDGPFEVRTDLALAKVGLETPTGWLAAADLSGRLRLDYAQQGTRRTVDARMTLKGGELLAANAGRGGPARGKRARRRMAVAEPAMARSRCPRSNGIRARRRGRHLPADGPRCRARRPGHRP
jgi:hypothetical protein